jgi:hypothetical protein
MGLVQAEWRMTTKLMASVAFGGGLGDPDFTQRGTLILIPISPLPSCGKPGMRFIFCRISIIPAWCIR